MLSNRTLAMGGLLLLVMCSVQAVNFGDDDDEDEVREEARESGLTTQAAGSKTVSVQGIIASDQFMKLHRGRTVRIFLDDGEFRAIVRQDGSFVVHNVPEGVHVLSVACPGFHFDTVRLEISAKGSGLKVKAFTNDEMVKRSPVPYPLKLLPASKLNYFVEREKFNPMSYLKNPMVLMVGFTMIMAFVMPKMTENLNDEEKDKIRGHLTKGPHGVAAEALGIQNKKDGN